MVDEEFLNTLRNIGTKWYQCPNGHAYVIGECGLAMIESRCPECGEKIGGRDHQLLKTNKLVDFDLDVKNNINITPVKPIKKSKNKDKKKNKKELDKDKKDKKEENNEEEEKEEKEEETKNQEEKEEEKLNEKEQNNEESDININKEEEKKE